jgi:tRNA-modifying protein YgfZ
VTPRVRIEPDQIGADIAAALRDGAIVAEAAVAVIELAGPGAVTAFQGLLTNDIEKPGDGAFLYGALLTPKGMVLVEGWAARTGSRVAYTVPASVAETTRELLKRYVPPRLARLQDRTAEWGVLRLAGPRSLAVAAAAGVPLPGGPGRTSPATAFGIAFEVAQPTEAGPPPFVLQLTAARDAIPVLTARLAAAGARVAPTQALELARVLSGWPSAEAELDDKTLPQEIRFDEVAGVSYTKGCYTGQETVSRLHFRGHANRTLRGLLFDSPPSPEPGGSPPPATVQYQDRDVGAITSLAWLPQGPRGGRWIGLAVVRREVTPGAMVRAQGVDARVVDLPIQTQFVVPA